MNKNKIIYYLMLSAFLVIVIILNIIFFIRNSNNYGNLNIIKKYSEIKFIPNDENVAINNDLISIKLSKNMNTSFNIYNIGNKGVYVNKVIVDGINSSVKKEDIIIKTSIKEGDFIKGGEILENKITISCNKCDFKENDYINFNMKYIFE